MKARIKKTGEIKEINEENISLLDYAHGMYKDKDGNKYHWKELEFIERDEKPIDWEEVRIKAAISALQGFAASPQIASIETLARWSVGAAYALVAELKKGGTQ